MAEGFSIRVDSNAKQNWSVFSALRESQLPFATAKALTQCAQIGRDVARANLGKTFTIRSQRVAKGFDFERAEKSDWPNPRARVGHKDKFLIQHAYGAQKRSTKVGEHVAIPTRLVAKQRSAGSGSIPRALKPESILDQKRTGAFKIPGVRIGRNLEAKKSFTGKQERLTYYILKPEVTIKPRWPFNQQMQDALEDNYEKKFAVAFDEAVATARKKVGL